MEKKGLILFISPYMDNNKKHDREENNLIRMSATTRENLGFTTETVELWPNNNDTKSRINKAVMLTVFHAYAQDIRDIKKAIEAGEIPKNYIDRIGFVTKNTFRKINSNLDKRSEDIWISNGIHDTVIGADPEFLFFNDEKVVSANNVLSNTGQFASDGAMAEIRPLPAIQPEALVENITSILKCGIKENKIKNLNWVCGCYHQDAVRDYPIGGHIHIGNPAPILKTANESRTWLFIIMNKIIDELLAIPLIKIDGKAGGKRRTSCKMGKYGFFGGYRTCEGRLEHRTLSGMWLLHPTVAKAVFGVTKLIIDEVFKRIVENGLKTDYFFPSNLRANNVWSNDFSSWNTIGLAKDLGCNKTSKEMSTILNESNPELINKQFVKNWMKHLSSFSTFNTYEEYVRLLSEILNCSFKEIDDFPKELKKNWLENVKFIV